MDPDEVLQQKAGVAFLLHAPLIRSLLLGRFTECVLVKLEKGHNLRNFHLLFSAVTGYALGRVAGITRVSQGDPVGVVLRNQVLIVLTVKEVEVLLTIDGEFCLRLEYHGLHSHLLSIHGLRPHIFLLN